MHPEKVQAVQDWPIPTKASQLYSFLMFANFYRRFIKDFSKITKPLHECCGKTANFKKNLIQIVFHYLVP